MMPTDRVQARYVLYTVGLNGPGREQPTVFLRHVSLSGDPLERTFSAEEVGLLMLYMQEESLSGYHPVVPVPVWSRSEASVHCTKDDSEPWIEVVFRSEGGKDFLAEGFTVEDAAYARSLLELHFRP
jgi:hypothetical protein